MSNPYDPTNQPPQGPPGQPPYGGGQPQYGQPQYGQPQYGQQPYPGQPGQAPYGAPAAALSSSAKTVGWVIAGSAAVVAISAFLPWASIGGISVKGLGGEEAKDGAITLVLALIALGGGVARGLGKRPSGAQLAWAIIALISGLLVTLIAIVDIADISSTKDDLDGFIDVSVGIGLWLTLVSGIVLGAAGVAAIVKRR